VALRIGASLVPLMVRVRVGRGRNKAAAHLAAPVA
jgi:hypothetical protein